MATSQFNKLSLGTALALVVAGFLTLATLTAYAAPVVTVTSIPVTNADGTITYTITVRNTGDQPATDVFIRNTMDVQEEFVSGTPPVDMSSTAGGQMTLTWAVPSVASGSGVFTVNLQTRARAGTPAGTVLDDTVLVEGLNFPDATAATTVLISAAVTPTPTPSVLVTPTPSATPIDPGTLPVTGNNLWTYALIAGFVGAGSLIQWRLAPSAKTASSRSRRS